MTRADVRDPTPSRWLTDHRDLLPPGGTALDVASGGGRHAIWLARAGFRVHAIDRDAEALARLAHTARAHGLDVTCETLDLETGPPPDLGRGRYDAIVVVNYLHRPLFPALREALVRGGRLFYQTFTAAQAARGRPTNPAYLLQPGELGHLVAPLVVRRSFEGDLDGKAVAAVVAERP